MESVDEALKKIDSGGYDNILSDLYGCEKLSYQRQRIVSALNLFERYFGTERKISLFSAPRKNGNFRKSYGSSMGQRSFSKC